MATSRPSESDEVSPQELGPDLDTTLSFIRQQCEKWCPDADSVRILRSDQDPSMFSVCKHDDDYPFSDRVRSIKDAVIQWLFALVETMLGRGIGSLTINNGALAYVV